MTDIARDAIPGHCRRHISDEVHRRTRRRYAAERRFKALGLAAVLTAMAALVILLVHDLHPGLPGLHAILRGAAGRSLRRGRRSRRTLRKSSFDALADGAIDAVLPFADRAHRAARRTRHPLRRSAESCCARRCSAIRRWSAARTPCRCSCSDTADLYLKGMMAEKDRAPAAGAATPSGTSGEITVALASGHGDTDPPVRAGRRRAGGRRLDPARPATRPRIFSI